MIAVIGSLNQDLVTRVTRHPVPGETVLGGDLAYNPGGKGANQAVAAARLGGSVSMVGRVGADEAGTGLLTALRDAGIDTRHVHRDATASTGHALISVDDTGENAIVVTPGANARLSPADCRAAAPVLAEARVTLLQQEVPDEVNHVAARLAGGIVVYNPAPAQPSMTVPSGVDVLVPNRTELAALTGHAVPGTLAQAVAAARSLTGPAAVVVTLGHQGVLLVEGNSHLLIPAYLVHPVDTTAAGDCFCAALAVALAEGHPLDRAARWANKAAALSTTRSGAQPSLPSRTEVDCACLEQSAAEVTQ